MVRSEVNITSSKGEVANSKDNKWELVDLGGMYVMVIQDSPGFCPMVIQDSPGFCPKGQKLVTFDLLQICPFVTWGCVDVE